MSHLDFSDNDVMSHTELLKLFATLEKISTTLARTTECMARKSLIKIWSINHNSVTVSIPVCIFIF